jgi:hypothetical protein
MGPTAAPETSSRNLPYTPCKIPKTLLSYDTPSVLFVLLHGLMDINLALIAPTDYSVIIKSNYVHVNWWTFLLFIIQAELTPSSKHVCDSWWQDPGGTEQYSIGR